MTTKEPDDSQLEVAIAAINAVLVAEGKKPAAVPAASAGDSKAADLYMKNGAAARPGKYAGRTAGRRRRRSMAMWSTTGMGVQDIEIWRKRALRRRRCI